MGQKEGKPKFDSLFQNLNPISKTHNPFCFKFAKLKKMGASDKSPLLAQVKNIPYESKRFSDAPQISLSCSS
jgi:hypothetical protein